MQTQRSILIALIIFTLVAGACALPAIPLQAATPKVAPSPTVVPSVAPAPEKNVALKKVVRVSASWVKDPPERAVNGNLNDWWGAGGPAPQWIEVDLGGLYSVSRIRVINQGPAGGATYRVLGRGGDYVLHLLHEFPGSKSENQNLEFSPETPWQDISTVRVELLGGSGWAGLREVEVYSREQPEPLEAASRSAPPFLSGVNADALQPITADNTVLLEHLAMFGRGTINELTWSPDGKTLAAAGTLGVWLYDAASLDAAPRLLEGHSRETLAAAFSSDGTLLYSGGQDGTVMAWNVASGEARDTSPLWNDFSYEVGTQVRGAEVWTVAFSPDHRELASGALDGTLRLWDLQTDKQSAVVTGHLGEVSDIAYSPDGKLLASSDYKGGLFIRAAHTGAVKFTLVGSEGFARALAFSPDGRLLASGGSDKVIHLWDTGTGKELMALKGHDGPILSLAFSPDGQTLASHAIGHTLLFWDIRSGRSRQAQPELLDATSLAFSPDGKRLVANSNYGALTIWDVATARRTSAILEHTGGVTSVAFSPDDSMVGAADQVGFLRIWDVRANKRKAILLKRSAIWDIAFGPDGKVVAAAGADGTITVWSITSGEALAGLTGHEKQVRSVAFSPDGKLIASGSTDKTVRLWDTGTWKQAAILSGHAGEVESVAFSPDGAWLVSTSADQTVRIWDVATRNAAGVLGKHDSFALNAVFSPDGSHVASAGADHSLRVWSLTKAISRIMGSLQFAPVGHGGWVTDVAFSSDGSILASSNVSTTSFYTAPGEIHLYSSQSGFPYALLRGHTKRVSSIAFSSDGRLLASGSADGSVRIWGTEAFVPPAQAPAAAASPAPSVPPDPTATPPVAPTPTEEADLPTSGNLALKQVVTASRSEARRPASRAFDGDLALDWGSGGFPPKWIQVDLRAPATITEIRLLVTQDPVGRTVHSVLVGSSPNNLKEVHRFDGETRTGDWLVFKPEQPLTNIQFVQVFTSESPSWVGWIEVEVIGER